MKCPTKPELSYGRVEFETGCSYTYEELLEQLPQNVKNIRIGSSCYSRWDEYDSYVIVTYDETEETPEYKKRLLKYQEDKKKYDEWLAFKQTPEFEIQKKQKKQEELERQKQNKKRKLEGQIKDLQKQLESMNKN